MTGDHAREWTSVPRRSRRDDGARPIPPNRAPTPCARANFGFSAFAESSKTRDAPSWPSWRHLWAPWSRASDRGRSRDARRRAAHRMEWRGARGRRFSKLEQVEASFPHFQFASCFFSPDSHRSADRCSGALYSSLSSRFLRGPLTRTARYGRARVVRGDGTARRRRRASPRLALGAASPAERAPPPRRRRAR